MRCSDYVTNFWSRDIVVAAYGELLILGIGREIGVKQRVLASRPLAQAE
jgi:hypothetical protein